LAIDEFLHATLAAIATSYFNAHRAELLDEAQVGRIVQEGLLPVIPRHAADLEIAHIYTPAREHARVGGDFLDFFQVGDCAAFIIGDLSGHGVEAAAGSVMMRSLFKAFMHENPDPADAMRRLNRVMAKELDIDQFATALAVCYDNRGGATLVSAGHPYPFLCDGAKCSFAKPSGMALAVDSQAAYRSSQIRLQPGGLFVAYTDGLVEARQHGDFFGEKGIVKAVNDVRDTPARAIAEHLVDSSLRHAGGKFDDDVAVLVLRRQNVAEIDASITEPDTDEKARAA
jgi:serine phosphatase RsbU (regulator of sigma subunit)